MPLRVALGVDRVDPLNSSIVPGRQTYAGMKARQCAKIIELKAALLEAGFDRVSKQAAVLGLSRSTAWKVLKSDHKQSGLSANTIKRMLASPHLPPNARQIIEDYVREKLLGAYGHAPKRLKDFRSQLGYAIQPTPLDRPPNAHLGIRKTPS
jgi:hypothetical protein